MNTTPNELAARPRVSGILLRVFVWGVGFGVGAAIVLVAWIHYEDTPKRWNTRALIVKNAKAEAFVQMDNQLKESSNGTIFTVDVENSTESDVNLDQGVRLMQANKGTGALHSSLLKLDGSYFIPAHHVVSVSLDNADLCAADTNNRECFNRYFGDQQSIVIFDDALKYEVEIPIPGFTEPKSTNALPKQQ